MTFITASPETLLKQATETCEMYLDAAVKAVKEANIPKDQQGIVIAAFIQACVQDFRTGFYVKEFGECLESIARVSSNISDSIDTVAYAHEKGAS